MEHHPTFLPPASSSAQAFGSPVFLMSSVQARAFDKLRGEAEIRGFPSYRGKDEAEDEAASSASAHGYPETEANASSGDEKKLSKRTSEKKIPTPKYAFQTRSHMDILDDGYRWRKYGQKAVKNNRFPRSYYRCTHQGCNVKKQVQRLSKDEGVVVTTYEGTHIHPIEKTSDNFERILSQMRIFTDL